MCGGCQSNGSAGSSAQQAAQISSLTNIVNTLTQSLGAFLNGHPIIAFENASDIALFDLTTGVGSGYLANWAICNGSSYLNPNTNLNVLTPNLLDKCLIQATGTYVVDAVTGNATQTLNVLQLPTHTHGVTDPGHTHGVIESPHTHGTLEGNGHQHVIAAGIPVTASGSTTGNSGHTHITLQWSNVSNNGSFSTNGATIVPALGSPQTTGASTSPYLEGENSHTHSVSVTGASGVGATNNAFTGISISGAVTNLASYSPGVNGVQPAETGITIGDTGSNNSFSVMQPSYAVLYAMKIY